MSRSLGMKRSMWWCALTSLWGVPRKLSIPRFWTVSPSPSRFPSEDHQVDVGTRVRAPWPRRPGSQGVRE